MLSHVLSLPHKFHAKLHHLKSNHSFYLNGRRRFSATHLAVDPQLHQSLTETHNLYNDLLKICLQECKKIQSRQVLDRMPERLRFSLSTGKLIHAQSLKHGFSSEGNLSNAVLDLYAKCGHADYAEKVFLHIQRKDDVTWNSIMLMNSRKGSFRDVLEIFGTMWSLGEVNQFSFAIVLSACAKSRDVELGKQVHCVVVKKGIEFDAYCEGALIDFYAKCDHLVAATRIFDAAITPDKVSWTALISGYAQVGLVQEAIEIFEEMQRLGHEPDNVVFVTVLNACVGQGRLEDGWRLFSQMPNPNVVAWNVMISGHVKAGNAEEAIRLFRNMIEAGVEPTRSTLGSVFSAIALVANHEFGLQVHARAVKQGLDSNVYAGSSLINMYSKCQKMESARAVFDGLEEKNNVLWNSLIGGYAQNGHAIEVLLVYFNMRTSGFQPDEYTYTGVLSACACLQNLDVGRQLHSVIMKNEFVANLYVGNAMVDMYAKCGALSTARKQFEQIRNHDHVSWNTIIVGYVQGEEEEEAFCLFRRMMSEGIAPDEVSLASIISAAANLQDLGTGRQVHCFMVKCGMERGLYAGSALIDMYCKCGVVEAATEIFSCMPERNVVCLNSLISGHAQLSLWNALNMFKYMLAEGFQPSEITFATLLEACADDINLSLGIQIHGFILKLGLSFTDEFLAVSLLGMYMSAHRNADAIGLFTDLPHPKSSVIWTVLISGTSQNGYCEDALLWYREMRRHNVIPDQATFASVLRACSILASTEDGRKIHCSVFHMGYDTDELTGSVLVDMYAKCGDVKSSAQVFREMISKTDVTSWNSMIVGYAKNGYAERAIEIFDEMKWANVKPDEVTFLGVLTACSHAGMVSEGREIYNTMTSNYGIYPRVDHYACMVDLYGRWGFLGEAENFINSLEFEPDSMIWATYLSSCRLHGEDIRGRHAAEKLIELEPYNSSPYVLLSSIHAASGDWEGVSYVRKQMSEKAVKRFPGCSWIIVGEETNFFVAGDKSHPLSCEIQALLKYLTSLMKDEGCISEPEYSMLGEDQELIVSPLVWAEAASRKREDRRHSPPS